MLEAGPELNRLVADAIELAKCSGKETAQCGRIGYDGKWVFQPSTDLNDAFWAAERTELFRTGASEASLMQDAAGLWIVSGRNGDWKSGKRSGVIAEAKSLPLAICAAILKLKGYADA